MRLSTTHSLGPIIALLSLAVSASELYRSSRFPAQETIPVAPFTYDGLSGPLNWYGLNKSGNALCDMGKNQSPIDITPATIGKAVRIEKGSSLELELPNVSSALFENLGSTVEIPCNATLTDAGKKFKLAQFHYHTPSEHRFNGEYMAMEQHFLFEAADASLAVITFMIEVDDTGFTGPLLTRVMAEVDKIATPGTSTMLGPLNFEPLLEHLKNNTVYRYTGSITSPPCTEEVNWIISSRPLRMDVATFKRAKKVLKFNSRYTQDSHGDVNLLEEAAKELRPGSS